MMPTYTCTIDHCGYTTSDLAGDGVFHLVCDHHWTVSQAAKGKEAKFRLALLPYNWRRKRHP